jgi:hypothetical protein
MRNRMFKLADQSSHKKHRHAAWLRPHAEMVQDYFWCGPALSRYSFDATSCLLYPRKQTCALQLGMSAVAKSGHSGAFLNCCVDTATQANGRVEGQEK